MHAWDEIDLLKRAIDSVASQRQYAGAARTIRIKLVIFVDRCGSQLDKESRLACDKQDWCTILLPPDPEVCPSLGSAAAKWELLSYVGQRIRPSDYFTFLDGDDVYVNENTLLDIYIAYFQPLRPYFAWGRQVGAFSDQCRDVPEDQRIAVELGENDIRELRWSFCHPRFFRGELISRLRESDFKRRDGTWLQKSTDRPLIYAAIEHGGIERSLFMGDEPHIAYSFTESNGLKRFSKQDVNLDKSYVTNELRRFKKLKTEIHVVVAVYDRDNTEDFLYHLSKSNLPDETILQVHIANNMPSRQPALVKLAARVSATKFNVQVTNMRKNLGGIARFILSRELLQTSLLDFVIFMDDDQYCYKNTVIELWNQRKHRAIVSWYGKSWHNAAASYWQPTFGFSEIKASSITPQTWNYAGTGMSILDTLIFSDERVFKIPSQYGFVEDVWLSYVLKANDWKLLRAYVSFAWMSELSETGQYQRLKATKEEMFSNLKRCDFPFISDLEYANVAYLLEKTTEQV